MYKTKQKVTYIEVNKQIYQIDFIRFKQIQQKNHGCQRQIRRIMYDPSLSNTQHHKQTPRNQNTTQSRPVRSQYTWQFQNNAGIWDDYDKDTAAVIEDRHTHNNPPRMFQCMIRKGTYYINLTLMTATDAETGYATSIRRLEPQFEEKNEDCPYTANRHIKGLDAGILQEIGQIVDGALNVNMLNIAGLKEPINLQNLVSENFANSPLLKEKCMNHVNVLKEILSDKQKRKHIIDKAKWNDTNKIHIHKMKLVEDCQLILRMTKKEFIKRLHYFADEKETNINIIPHLISDNNEHINNNQHIKYLWMVTIYSDIGVACDIAISVKLTKTIKKIKTVVPTGIYLYTMNQQEGEYALNLHELKIGNIHIEAKKIRDLRNEIQSYKEKIELYKRENEQYVNQLMSIQQYQWEYQSGKEFKPFDQAIANEMEISYRCNADTYRFINPSNQHWYTINFKELKQYNEFSQNCRNIRRVIKKAVKQKTNSRFVLNTKTNKNSF